MCRKIAQRPIDNRAANDAMLQEVFSTITPQYWQFWIGAVLVVIVLVGRGRLHRWVLFVPNLIMKQVAGRKDVIAVPESDA